MPRLFISHSSRDNVQALAFQNWLFGQGWTDEDIFLDLHDIGAGERWRDTLRKANASCEAVLLLASPDSLDSHECQREIALASDLGKSIIIAILRDVAKSDARLAQWSETQFVDLSAPPLDHAERVSFAGAEHQVAFNLAALLSIKGRLEALGIAPGSFKWEPRPGEGPYPGLAAFDEDEAGIYFGRDADMMVGLTLLRRMRKGRSPRVLLIQAASGAGKSSFLKAGLWPRLKRDADFAPLAILRPALGILTGPDGFGQRATPFFQRHGKTKVPGEITARLMKNGSAAATALSSLVAEATQLAAIARQAGNPDARPPAPLIAIDQGEELFAAENASESERFLEMLAGVLREPPSGVDPYVLVTIRADSVDTLLQRWPALGLDTPASLYLPPLAPSAYRDVIVRPAEVYTRHVRRLAVEPGLADQLVREAQGADALPLLAFTLEKLFREFGADGNLTLERYEAMGGIGGSIDRALAEAQRKAGPAGTTENLRRLMVPGLATWDMAANAAKRLVANEAELLGGDRASLLPLADALVANRLLTRGAGTIEVAHEALLRRPLILGWLDAQKDDLKRRDDILREAAEWAQSSSPSLGPNRNSSLLLVRRGERLQAALTLSRSADYVSALSPANDYLAACIKQETAGRRAARRTQAAIYTLLMGVIGALTAVIYKEPLLAFAHEVTTVRPYIAENITRYVLSKDAEHALKPGETFRECASTCPEMVVIPAGTFMMGSPEGEGSDDEHPQHEVRLNTFAASRHEVTFDDYEECVRLKGCAAASDSSFGRGRRPVINVTWDDAKTYVAWLARVTGQPYRLLTEAEWEYAARAGNPRKWSFGDDETELGEYAWFSENSDSKTQPVMKKKPNAFGLYDMHGNVWEWTEDIYHDNYSGAPVDGTAWTKDGDPSRRVARGGSWNNDPDVLCSAIRGRNSSGSRNYNIGFRVGRTLSP